MTSDPVLERLGRLLAEVVSVEAPSPDADLIEANLLDSLALVELLVEIEREFKVELTLAQLDIDDFRTLRAMGELVARSNRTTAGPEAAATG